MDSSPLLRSPIGQLVKISGFDPRFNEDYACEAFVPHPLPSEVDLRADTYRKVVQATAALARADEAVALLKNPWLLVRPAIRREAVSTSALEGTYATIMDVLAADFMRQDELDPSVLEVRNYVQAAEHAFEWIADRHLTIGMIENLQGELVRDTKSANQDAGRLRTTQVFIGAGNRRVTEARFVPPPPGDLLRDGVLQWAEWVNRSDDEPALVKAALAHYQFEALHPFTDGNGRLGRLVSILQLVRAGELRAPVVNISPWLEPRRGEYQDRLFQLSATGDLDTWVKFFCDALLAQSKDAVERVNALRSLQEDLIKRTKDARARGAAIDIARDLIGFPVLTVSDAAEIAGVSFQAANQGVSRLVDIGILRQYSNGRYDRLFVSDDVLRIIQT